MSDEFIASCDVVRVLRELLAQDEQFLRDHHGYCREYPQNARVEFITELVDKCEEWQHKASAYDYQEDYCNERAAFLNELLLLIAHNWQDYP
jgi:hypothetical protein